MTNAKPLTVAIVDKEFDTDEAGALFGKRWGRDMVTLSDEHLAALQAGKLLAIDVMMEYVVFLELRRE